jgi:hypothetical protein
MLTARKVLKQTSFFSNANVATNHFNAISTFITPEEILRAAEK